MLSLLSKARLREMLAHRRASLRILKSMATLMEGRLNRQIHGFLSIGEVSKLMKALTTMTDHAELLCASVGFNADEDEEVSLRILFESPGGKRIATDFCLLARNVDDRVESWDEGRRLSREQLTKLDPSPLVVRDRILAEQFTSFCRQAEAHVQLLRAQLTLHRLQFWMDGEKLRYSGEAEAAAPLSPGEEVGGAPDSAAGGATNSVAGGATNSVAAGASDSGAAAASSSVPADKSGDK